GAVAERPAVSVADLRVLPPRRPSIVGHPLTGPARAGLGVVREVALDTHGQVGTRVIQAAGRTTANPAVASAAGCAPAGAAGRSSRGLRERIGRRNRAPRVRPQRNGERTR